MIKRNHSEIYLERACAKNLQNLLKKIHCEEKFILLKDYQDHEMSINDYRTGLEGFIHIPKEKKDYYHIRYVGYPHALIMQKQNLDLEEYLQMLKSYSKKNPFLFDNYKIFYLPINNSTTIKCSLFAKISGNNEDGIIITEKNKKVIKST